MKGHTIEGLCPLKPYKSILKATRSVHQQKYKERLKKRPQIWLVATLWWLDCCNACRLHSMERTYRFGLTPFTPQMRRGLVASRSCVTLKVIRRQQVACVHQLTQTSVSGASPTLQQLICVVPIIVIGSFVWMRKRQEEQQWRPDGWAVARIRQEWELPRWQQLPERSNAPNW